MGMIEMRSLNLVIYCLIYDTNSHQVYKSDKYFRSSEKKKSTKSWLYFEDPWMVQQKNISL